MRSARYSSIDYRRCARRLRHVHRNDPVRLARSLSHLSQAYDVARARAVAPASVCRTTSTDRLGRFAARVADELEGGVLPYSRRLHLLQQAHRQGIRRFEANLMIAAVQERFEGSPPRVPHAPRRSSSWLGAVVLMLLIQGVVLAAAGYVFAM